VSPDQIPAPGSLEEDRIILTWQPLPKWKDTNFHFNPCAPDRVDIFYDWGIPREDPVLVEVVRELGEAANGRFATLQIMEIPEEVEYEIYSWNGMESVHEVYQVWQWDGVKSVMMKYIHDL